jgi:hypothetical protein
VTAKLTMDYGKSYSPRNLKRRVDFTICFPDKRKVAELTQLLSWSYFVELLNIKNEIERSFYTQLCRVEQ